MAPDCNKESFPSLGQNSNIFEIRVPEKIPYFVGKIVENRLISSRISLFFTELRRFSTRTKRIAFLATKVLITGDLGLKFEFW